MKKLISLLLIAGFCNLVQAEKIKNPLMASDTVVWAGLDYSMVHMIGSDDPHISYNFITPDFQSHYHFKKMFPEILEKWNQLFLDEKTDEVSSTIEKQVIIDIGGVTERNKLATTNQIVITSDTKGITQESSITQQDIVNEVRSYKMENTNGLGLVFIVDQLVRRFYEPADMTHNSVISQMQNDGFGSVYIVFFDVSTKEVISVERQIHHVSSAGNFLNFYFGPIKDTASTLGKYRASIRPPASSRKRK